MDDNAPAYPTYEGNYEGKFSSQGLTKLEYFAASAMNGILSNQALIDNLDYSSIEWIAIKSFHIAAAMIKETENG